MSSSHPSAVPARASERSRRENLPAAGREGTVTRVRGGEGWLLGGWRVCAVSGLLLVRSWHGMAWLGRRAGSPQRGGEACSAVSL